MKNINIIAAFISFGVLIVSCEEVINLDLNTTDPKYVIDANLDDISEKQVIRVSQTVNFDEPYPSKPVDNASVLVSDVNGVRYSFEHVGNGLYQKGRFTPKLIGSYSLTVRINDDVFTSTTSMVPYVDVDSVGIVKEKMFNEDYYFIKFKFQDPEGIDNYYKYSYSINNKPFKFLNVFSDKYNNGLYVAHEITNFDKNNKFVVGDSIIIRRECISKDVYTFWNELQSINPGTAAPANPKSNISNGSLGYFSVSSAKHYKVAIVEGDEENEGYD